MPSRKRSPKEGETQLVQMYVSDAFMNHRMVPVELIEIILYEQSIRYVLADGYRRTKIDFDDPSLDFDFVLQQELAIIIGVLRTLLPSLCAVEGTEAERRIMVLESHISVAELLAH